MSKLWPLGIFRSLSGVLYLMVPLLVLTGVAELFFSDSAVSILTNFYINAVAVIGQRAVTVDICSNEVANDVIVV